MSSSDARPRPADGVVAQRRGDSVVILDLAAGTYFALDDVGARMWELCDGTRTLSDVAAVIETEFDAPVEVVLADIRALVGELTSESLLVEAQ